MALSAGLGPYEILGQIGAGGMAEVYRARHPRPGREVAVEFFAVSMAAKRSGRERLFVELPVTPPAIEPTFPISA